MKKQNRMILIFLLVIIFPTIVGSYFFINARIKEDYSQRQEYAKQVASIYVTDWDQFISESVSSLKTLSLAAETFTGNSNKMRQLLTRTHQTDPRYGGIYLLDKTGVIVTGSNDYLKDNQLANESYVKDVIRTKDTIISDHQEVLTNGQKVIGLATPVLDQDKKLLFVIVSHFRVDYVKNVMKVLTPHTKLLIMNSNDEVIINLNMKEPIGKLDDKNWVTAPIDRLPWSIYVKIPDLNRTKIIKDSTISIISILVLTNILFILIKYLLLKRQTAIEKKQNEAQKLELVGTLAASTAHEIRNPLTGIKGLVQLLSEKHKNEDDQFYFSVIQKEINRINLIVSEFLILGKPTVQKMEVLDLKTILNDLQPIISSEANLYNVNLNFSFPEDQVMVECTKDQMKQVILNVMKNALESMVHGGHLMIELSADQRVSKMTISDTGIGIPKEALEKIFNPFYTSKDTGTGLGLVVCKRILHSFHGEIHIESVELKGTTVTITLPRYKKLV